MGDFFKRNRLRFLLCILALLIGVLLYAAMQSGQTTGVMGVVLSEILLIPGNMLIHHIAGDVNVVASLPPQAALILIVLATAFTNQTSYQTENDRLKEENAALKNKLLDYEDTKQQLTELEKFMGIKKEHADYVLSDPCSIIGYVTNDPFHSFIINKGSDDGIELQDPVVTAEGIVGIISNVSNTYSTVETICSPKLSIGAMSATGSDTGILEGEISLAADYQCRMIYLERDTKLQEGDLIKTSGTGGLFPQGYLIGSVDHLELMDSGLSKYAVLNPAVNFDALTSVMVILDYDGKGAETIPEDQTAVQTTVTAETTTLAETTTETTTTVTVLTTGTEAANGQN